VGAGIGASGSPAESPVTIGLLLGGTVGSISTVGIFVWIGVPVGTSAVSAEGRKTPPT